MDRFVGIRPLLRLALLAPLLLIIQPSWGNARTQNLQKQSAVRLMRPESPPRPEVAAMNAWTVGIAGGLLEGAPIRLAAEIARVVDDGENLHVLPVVTRGATENVNSLLYLRGIDAAIINSDALDEYKSQVPDIQRRLAYVLNLFPSELHIFVRPEIQSLNDLVGKKVNFNTQGTAAAYSGPLIFSRLGLEVEKTFIPHQVALVAFNCAVKSNRFARVDRFVDYLFSRIEKLQGPGFDAKWKSINLGATVPGLARFPSAQAWLDRQPRARRASQ